MKYAITKFQIYILTKIARRIVWESHEHKRNITIYYRILTEAARESFHEDNKPTLDGFLEDCHKESLEG